MDAKGHAALVTGGGSGLGAATARRLAQAGAKVAVLDINLDGAKAVAAEIGGLAVACDVADAASAEAAVAAARKAHGPARVLINCAGIGPAARIVGREGPMPLQDFARVININLIGSFNLMRLAADDMSKLEPFVDGERGVIVSTASVAAYDGQIGQAAYSASKGGIVALTLPAARELARFGIRVNVIAPGIFATPLLLGMPKPVQESLAASIPFPSRFGTGEEYAKLVMHILDNVMLNGEVIRLDGAIRMPPK
jgi:NAD(P)-dependent dehydrogenase (short-subunit alcohol dehydrogenase family)